MSDIEARVGALEERSKTQWSKLDEHGNAISSQGYQLMSLQKDVMTTETKIESINNKIAADTSDIKTMLANLMQELQAIKNWQLTRDVETRLDKERKKTWLPIVSDWLKFLLPALLAAGVIIASSGGLFTKLVS